MRPCQRILRKCERKAATPRQTVKTMVTTFELRTRKNEARASTSFFCPDQSWSVHANANLWRIIQLEPGRVVGSQGAQLCISMHGPRQVSTPSQSLQLGIDQVRSRHSRNFFPHILCRPTRFTVSLVSKQSECRTMLTPLCKALVVVAYTHDREACGAEQCNKRRDGHGTEKRPVDEGEAVNTGVEHHGPRKHEEERDAQEHPGQFTPFEAHRIPTLYRIAHNCQRTRTGGCRGIKHTIINQGINS